MDELIETIKKVSPRKWIEQNQKSKKEIKRLMKKYAAAYYEGNALITDLDFDVLVDTLKLIDPKDKYLTTPGWGYKIKKGSKHIYEKIGTLPYYYDYLEISKLFNEKEEIIITPKFDGINFAAYFKKGKFKKCLTRGNGTIGKNISWAFKQKMTLSKELKKSSFALNGEVIYLDNPNTDECFRNRVACYLNKKTKNTNSKIVFMPFALINTEIDNYLSQIELINSISPNKIIYKKFKQLPDKKTLSNLFKEFKNIYQIDGLVITNKDKSKQIAYKFKEELR